MGRTRSQKWDKSSPRGGSGQPKFNDFHIRLSLNLSTTNVEGFIFFLVNNIGRKYYELQEVTVILRFFPVLTLYT
jgi:hypothetical protein